MASVQSVLNLSVFELTLVVTVAFLLSNVSLLLLLGESTRLTGSIGSMKEGFSNLMGGFSLAPPRGCGLGRPGYGNAQNSVWGPNADVDAPYDTGAYPYEMSNTDRCRLMRSPRPLAVKKPCRAVQGNPPSARGSNQPPSQPGRPPRTCRSLPYQLTADLPTEQDLWPAPLDAGDGLGLPLTLSQEGFTDGNSAPKVPAPMQAVSSASGGNQGKYNFIFNQN